jgi:Uma2 family endonuclease
MYEYPQSLCMSDAEYLRVEEAARDRHEYVAGRSFAMAGAPMGHNEIVANLLITLGPTVKQAGCRVMAADMRVKVEALGNYYYPDVVVTCERNPKAVFLTAPCLIFEVLSESTKDIDNREKLMAYKAIPFLKEYALVHQDRRRVELNRKNANGDWQLHVYEGSDTVQLTSVDSISINLDLDSVYDGTEIDH